MTRLVKLILGAVIAIFLFALIWVIIVAINQPKKNQTKTNQKQTPTLVGEPSTSSQNLTATESSSPAPKPTEIVKPNRNRTIIIEEEIVETTDSGAWASAGSNNGSTWAQAHTN